MPITVRDMIRRLEADGWRWERTRGSHRVYSHPTKPGIVVVPGKLGKQLPAAIEVALEIRRKNSLHDRGLRKIYAALPVT